jgi:diguanylate cyclase (GGDEF)-like protein
VTSRDTPRPGPLQLPRLNRIRTKLLAFAVVIAILPAFVIGWVSYSNSKHTLRDNIGAGLAIAAQQAARETDLWVRERLYDLRVMASSYEVTENFERSRRTGSVPARTRVSEYLESVRGRLTDYLDFQVLALDGRVVASTRSPTRSLTLSPDQTRTLREGQSVFGGIVSDSLDGPSLLIAVPVGPAGGRVIGVLAAHLQLQSLDSILNKLQPSTEGRVLLIDRLGVVLHTAGATHPGPDSSGVASLLESGAAAREFLDSRGQPLLGSAATLGSAPWVAVAEVRQDIAYRALIRLRNLSLVAILSLALLLGGVGYVIGLYVVRPIDGLTGAATGVASGDLDVELPVVGRDEVASLTEVFNDMVRRLREDRDQIATMEGQLKRRNQELEELSITDGLTGLRNRRHIMTTLDQEFARAGRTRRPVAVLMLDVDGFKQLNDRLGHQAGDEILIKIASAIRSAVRGVDYAARYGGEEFVVVLPETDQAAAQDVGERIREYVAGTILAGDGAMPVTLSIGVAVYPTNGPSTAEVLARADAALYRAKERGRNRVEVAGSETGPAG